MKADYSYIRKCCWCHKVTTLVEKRSYCIICYDKCLKECSICLKPYDNIKYFYKKSNSCIKCTIKFSVFEKRLLKQLRKRKIYSSNIYFKLSEIAKCINPESIVNFYRNRDIRCGAILCYNLKIDNSNKHC